MTNQQLAAVLQRIADGHYNDMDSRSTLKFDVDKALDDVIDAIEWILAERHLEQPLDTDIDEPRWSHG